jgi:hypothetical protein
MADTFNDGGPVYPQLQENRVIHVSAQGMSLRDAAALAAFRAFTERMYMPLTDLGYVDETALPRIAKAAARHAFAFADAFIAAREAKSDG